MITYDGPLSPPCRLVRHAACGMAVLLSAGAMWMALMVLIWLALTAVIGDYTAIAIIAIVGEPCFSRQTVFAAHEVE